MTLHVSILSGTFPTAGGAGDQQVHTANKINPVG